MGVEFLLLFGLGVTGVVLTNLLTGDTATDIRPSSGTSVADLRPMGDGEAEAATAAEVVPTPTPEIEGTDAADAVADRRIPIAMLPHQEPHLWGHPAPLARLLALIVVSAVLLCSVLWGLGWFATQAIARAIGG